MKKDKKESIKYNKINKVINILIIILAIAYIINNVVMYYNNDYSIFFIKEITNKVNGIFYEFASHINYLSFIKIILFYISIFIFLIINIYYEYLSTKELSYRSKIVNISYTIIILFSIYIVTPSLLGALENHMPNMDYYLFKDTSKKTYTKTDLLNLEKYLKDKVIEFGDNIERNENNEIITKINYNEQAIEDLLNVSSKLDLLSGRYPKKSSPINNFIRGILGSKVVGFTTPYNTYFDYEGSKTNIINTVTHEFCHTKGLIRENETVYCAFLAGSNSNNELSKYGAYLDAFNWVSEALSQIDYYQAASIEDEVISKCLTKNYSELCDMYTKNNEEYINGSEKLIISTYYLKNYKNYEKELNESLKILFNAGAKIKVSGKETTLEKIMELIKQDSNNRVNIEMDINRKKFNKIKGALNNSKLYLSIYQKNKEDQESKEKKDNPEKYYLSPFKDQDENIIINFTYGSVEYEYSRVARLLLEHFDKYGY